MKKTIAILISMFMILSLAACGNSANRTGQPAGEGANDDVRSPQEGTDDDMPEKDSNADDMENAEISGTQQEEGGTS